MRGVVVQVSGGVDSAGAALEVHRLHPHDLLAHFVDYGQPYARQEGFAAAYVARTVGLELHVTTVRGLALSQADTVAAYVPLRNAVLGALSANLAAARGWSRVAVGSKSLGHRAGDPYSFRDATAPFWSGLGLALSTGLERGDVQFVQPMAGLSKRAAVELVRDGGLDLDRLWWCYDGSGTAPCGRCYHCEDVRKARSA